MLGGRISIKSCICDIAHSYRKHEHVFKVQAFNGSEYLLRGLDKKDMLAWIRDIQVWPGLGSSAMWRNLLRACWLYAGCQVLTIHWPAGELQP